MSVDFIEGTDYVRVDRWVGLSISDPGYHFQMRSWDGVAYHLYFDKLEPEETARVSYVVTSDAPGACPLTYKLIVVRPHFFLSASSVEEIRYGEQADIYIEARNPCEWIPPPLPDSVTYSASIISGIQYGVLLNTLTNDSGSTLQGLQHEQGFLSTLAFIADGIMPDSVVEVRIKVNTSDTRIQAVELSININPGCLVVSLSPNQIALGDTANIILENKLPNGTRVPYPADRTFEIWINNGEQYGILQSNSGDVGSDIYGQQPFKFIAADSIDTDSVRVEIEAWMPSGGGGVADAISLGTNDTLHTTGTMSKTQAVSDAKRGSHLTLISAKEKVLNRSIAKLRKRLTVIGEKTGNKSRFDHIIAKVEARLLNRDGQTDNTIPKTQKPSAKTEQMVTNDLDEGESCGRPVADVIIQIKPELIVTIPQNEFHIKSDPEMPDLKEITATVKNYHGKVKYHSQLNVEWQPPGTDLQTTKGYGETKENYIEADAQKQTSLPITWQTGIRGGSSTDLYVQAVLPNKILSKTEKNKFKIIGCNPTNAVFKTAIENTDVEETDVPAFEAIVYLESQFQHFKPCPGFPYQGIDHNDIGICQINKPRNGDIIWDWRENILRGGAIFNEKKGYVNGYASALKAGKVLRPDGKALYPLTEDQLDWYEVDKIYNPTTLTAEMLLKETIQKYNKGAYWRWLPNDKQDLSGPGQWIAEPPNNYCESVWNYITNHPSDWNTNHSCE
jgi:hypothetical protein